MQYVDTKTDPENNFLEVQAFNGSLACGPEILGFYDPKAYAEICNDDKAIFVDTPNGKRPFLLPVGDHPDLNTDYFTDTNNVNVAKPIYYLFPPGTDLTSSMVEQMHHALIKATSEEASFFVQFEENDAVTQQQIDDLFSDAGISIEEVPLIDAKNATESSVYHFTATANYEEPVPEVGGNRQGMHGQDLFRELVGSGQAEALPENGTVVLLPELLVDNDGEYTGLVDKLWKIYDQQMDILIENHPRYQRFHEDEFKESLLTPDSINIAHFEDGEPVIIFTAFTDVNEHATWLDGDTVHSYAGENADILYCSAAAVDFDKQGQGKMFEITSLVDKLIRLRGREYKVYFESTNISATYVPTSIEDAFTESAKIAGRPAHPKVESVAKYVQKLYKII